MKARTRHQFGLSRMHILVVLFGTFSALNVASTARLSNKRNDNVNNKEFIYNSLDGNVDLLRMRVKRDLIGYNRMSNTIDQARNNSSKKLKSLRVKLIAQMMERGIRDKIENLNIKKALNYEYIIGKKIRKPAKKHRKRKFLFNKSFV